jgi:hypothetical protein
MEARTERELGFGDPTKPASNAEIETLRRKWCMEQAAQAVLLEPPAALHSQNLFTIADEIYRYVYGRKLK